MSAPAMKPFDFAEQTMRATEVLEHRPGEHVGRCIARIAAEPCHPLGIELETPVAGLAHQAACRARSRMVKSQTSGRWSDSWTSGISKRFTWICELCRMKSSSLRGLELG